MPATIDGKQIKNSVLLDAGSRLDVRTAAALLLGTSAATSVEIGAAGIPVVIPGDLTVLGTTVTINSELQTADNYILLNSEYTSDTPQSCGLIFNVDPSATSFSIDDIASDVITVVSGDPSAVLSAGDFILIQNPNTASNAGVYEVLSATTTTVTIDPTPSEQFAGTGLADDVTTQGVMVGVSLLVFEATSGGLQTGFGTTGPISRTALGGHDFLNIGSATSAVSTGDLAASGGVSLFFYNTVTDTITLSAEGLTTGTFTGANATTPTTAGAALTVGSGAGNTTGAGGLSTYTSGAGGITGPSGVVSVISGPGGATSGNSGNVSVDSGPVTLGITGTVTLGGTNASTVIMGNASVGTIVMDATAISIVCGAGSGAGTGDSLFVSSGAGGPTGNSGSAQLTSGPGGGTSGRSSDTIISTGDTTDGITGDVRMETGWAFGAGNDSGRARIDTAPSAGGTNGVVDIGHTYASAVNIGRAGIGVFVPSALNVGTGITPSTNNGDVVFGDATRSVTWVASSGNFTVGTATASMTFFGGGSLQVQRQDAGTSDILQTLVLVRTSSGTTAAGFGTRIQTLLKNSTGLNVDVGIIRTQLETVGALYDGEMRFNLANGGVGSTGVDASTLVLTLRGSDQSAKINGGLEVGASSGSVAGAGSIVAGDGVRSLSWDASAGSVTLLGTGNNAAALKLGSGTAASSTRDVGSNTTFNAFTFSAFNSAAVGGAGLGSQINFQGETSTADFLSSQCSIISTWDDATTGAEYARLELTVKRNSANRALLTLGNTTTAAGNARAEFANNAGTRTITFDMNSVSLSFVGAAAIDGSAGITIGGTTATAVNIGRSGGSIGLFGAAAVSQQANIVSLTDNSGGTANDTIASITNAANAGSADVGPTADAIADLAAKVNGILTILNNVGIMA